MDVRYNLFLFFSCHFFLLVLFEHVRVNLVEHGVLSLEPLLFHLENLIRDKCREDKHGSPNEHLKYLRFVVCFLISREYLSLEISSANNCRILNSQTVFLNKKLAERDSTLGIFKKLNSTQSIDRARRAPVCWIDKVF